MAYDKHAWNISYILMSCFPSKTKQAYFPKVYCKHPLIYFVDFLSFWLFFKINASSRYLMVKKQESEQSRNTSSVTNARLNIFRRSQHEVFRKTCSKFIQEITKACRYCRRQPKICLFQPTKNFDRNKSFEFLVHQKICQVK